MSSKPSKKRESTHRVGSALGHTPRDVASFVASAFSSSSDLKKGKFPMWPEWNEADINSEKWDMGKATKEKEKPGRSSAMHFFEDPEGKIELPSQLKVHSWKRPQEFITNMSPVVVKDEHSCDLLTANEHLTGSELMRWIISEINAVWRIYNSSLTNTQTATELPVLSWKPWEHIYALCKASKGHIPLYNNYGKYVVKLYWMGCWRKIVLDDTLPFSEDNKLLVPATPCEGELWPMLLSKAIIKLASVDTNGFAKKELGEFTVMHSLTGWLPEVIPLQNEYLSEVWNFLKIVVPEFKLPNDDESPESISPVAQENTKENMQTDVKADLQVPVIIKATEKSSKEKADVKDSGKKKVDKDKNRSASHSARPSSDLSNILQQFLHESSSVPLEPQMVVYASYLPLHLNEQKISVLGQMADSAEKLRQYGLSHTYNHPVLVTRTRSCPLVAPVKPPPIPRWKLIRQKKEVNLTDEAKEPVMIKPDQFIEITSPFLNFRSHSPSMPSEGHILNKNPRKCSLVSSSLISVSEVEENVQEGDEIKENLMSNSGESLQTSSIIQDLGASELTNETGEEDANKHQDENPADSSLEPGKLSEEMKLVCKETWVDFSDFCKCFQTLYVFHKPSSYPYSVQKSDFKATDSCSYFLFVDSLKPTEILVSFSALLRWGDNPFGVKEETTLQKGLLTAEQFTWKSLLTGPVVLKIHTCVTKATVINLPPGRHVLRFTASSPLGHHIHLCSAVPFVFGDEESVMPYLDKESYRFMELAAKIIKAIGNVMTSFSSEIELPRAFQELRVVLHPQTDKASHLKVFNNALWTLLTESVGKKVTPDLIFAFRAFTLDFGAISPAEFHPMPDAKGEVPPSWQNRTSTDIEEVAAIKLQACWKGIYMRKCWSARQPGTRENTQAKAFFDKVWGTLEPNAQQHGINLLRYIFKHSPASHEYACYNDECYRVSFADYTVNYPDQPSNSWFVVFREIFHMPEDILVVPKMYTTLPACVLHVVNNDTLEEIPWVFNKVVPHIYTKNKKGYAFIAEAQTSEHAVTTGKFRLRLIGACNPLPLLSRETLNNSFSLKEIKDYYIPNNKDLILRYTVKTTIAHTATIHVQTSKPDVYFKIQILDDEEEVAHATGKGQARIPAFCFLPAERPSSCQSNKSQALVQNAKKGRIGSGGSQKGKTSARPGSGIHIPKDSENPEDRASSPHPVHKYIIHATVLYKSWTLTESQMAFVQSLKELEKQEIRVFEEVSSEVHHGGEGQKQASTPKTGRKGKTEKPEKEKSGKDKDRERELPTPISRPESRALQQTDLHKPIWSLRIVSQANEADTIEVKKDTERLDKIKAMKQAWEMAEPGRAVKALQSRLQYINKHLQKPKEDSGETKNPEDAPVLHEETIPAKESEIPIIEPKTQLRNELEPLDLTPFLRKTRPNPMLRDEFVIQQQSLQKAAEIQQYRQFREEVMYQREQENIARKALKKKVLQTYEDLQISIEKAREQMFNARESYKNKLLEAEKMKQDAQVAQETSHKTELKKSPSPKRKSAKSPGKSK